MIFYKGKQWQPSRNCDHSGLPTRQYTQAQRRRIIRRPSMEIPQQRDHAGSAIPLVTALVVTFLGTAASQAVPVYDCGRFNNIPSASFNEDTAVNGTVLLTAVVSPNRFWDYEAKTIYPANMNISLREWLKHCILTFRPSINENSTRCELSGSGNQSVCKLVMVKTLDFEAIRDEYNEVLASIHYVMNIQCKNMPGLLVNYEYTLSYTPVDDWPTLFPTDSVTIAMPLQEMTSGKRVYTVVPIDNDANTEHQGQAAFLNNLRLAPDDGLLKHTGGGQLSLHRDATAADFSNNKKEYTLTSAGASSMTVVLKIDSENSVVTGKPATATAISARSTIGGGGNSGKLDTPEDPDGTAGQAGASKTAVIATVSSLAIAALLATVIIALVLLRKRKKKNASESTPTALAVAVEEAKNRDSVKIPANNEKPSSVASELEQESSYAESSADERSGVYN